MDIDTESDKCSEISSWMLSTTNNSFDDNNKQVNASFEDNVDDA